MPASGTLFYDDFTSGNLSKSANGWSWSGVWVDVVPGFSAAGGNAARFTLSGNPSLADSADAWSELRFQIGTPSLTEVWVTYWLYYPSGREATSRGPRFVHRTPAGPTNNKFFLLWEDYAVNHLMYGTQTWSDATTNGDGYLTPFYRDPSGYSNHYWDVKIPWETDAYRGRWIKIEVHSKAASAPGVADGVMQYYRDGVPVIDIRNVNGYQSLGSNTWKAGYLLGWANSGFSQTTYAYVSNVSFSTTRLAAAP